MKLKKLLDKDRKNLNSRIAIGWNIAITAGIVVTAWLALNGNLAACIAITVGAAIQMLWNIWLQQKNVKPLEMFEELLAAKKNNGKNQTIYLPETGHTEKLVGNVAMALNENMTAGMLSAQSALYALQSQINPHFLYNTLETIRSQALSRGANEVADMTEALATLFRYSISRPNEMVTLSEEIENVKCYLMIQKSRFPDKFDVQWKIEEDDEMMQCVLPVLTIQPLVENAIYHGLEQRIENGMICVCISSTQNKFVVAVSDNGLGISEQALIKIRKELGNELEFNLNAVIRNGGKRKGIALNNINQRIKVFFGKEYGLNLYSVPGAGTTAEVVMPKRTKREYLYLRNR